MLRSKFKPKKNLKKERMGESAEVEKRDVTDEKRTSHRIFHMTFNVNLREPILRLNVKAPGGVFLCVLVLRSSNDPRAEP